MLYFSHFSADLSQTFTLYASIHATYSANFIEITDIIQQINSLNFTVYFSPIFGTWIGVSKQNVLNFQTFILFKTTKRIPTKFCQMIKTPITSLGGFKCAPQIQDGERLPSWKKTKNRHISANHLIDFDKNLAVESRQCELHWVEASIAR